MLLGLVGHQPLPHRLGGGLGPVAGRPVEEAAVVGHVPVEPGLAVRRVSQELEPEGSPVEGVDGGQRLDARPPQGLLLPGRRLEEPALHRVGQVVRRDAALDVVHHEEGHAEHRRVLLVPAQVGHRHGGLALEVLEDLVLEREVRIEEQGVLGGVDPHHESVVCRLAVLSPSRGHEDGLVGEAVGPRGVDLDDRRVGPLAELGGEPGGEDGGEVRRIALGELRHGPETTHRRSIVLGTPGPRRPVCGGVATISIEDGDPVTWEGMTCR